MTSNTINLSPIENASKSAWQIKEPEDKSDPVEHESFQSIPAGSDFSIFGASIRGKNHAHRGKYREDAFCFVSENGFNIMAVADGAGSCSHSRIGAAIAVKSSVRRVKDLFLKQMKNDGTLDQTQMDLPLIPTRVQSWLENAGNCAIQTIEAEAQKRKTEVKKFSTTLTLSAVWKKGPENIAVSLQIGDGLAAWFKKREPCAIIGEQDRGTYNSQSLFLTSKGVKNSLKSRIVTKPLDGSGIFALMTDGIADDFYPPKKDLEKLSASIHKLMDKTCDPETQIPEWIRYDKKGSYDDRTIVFLKID